MATTDDVPSHVGNVNHLSKAARLRGDSLGRRASFSTKHEGSERSRTVKGIYEFFSTGINKRTITSV